jgi:hypothetical protein
MIPPEPTSEDCEKNSSVVWVTSHWTRHGFAAWYPQMGGYVGRALIFPQTEETNVDAKAGDVCFDVYVWHDGEFPFGDRDADGRIVALLHHCSPRQFIEFGELVQSRLKAVKQ